MTESYGQDPRDEIDNQAGAARAPRQEVVGPTDALAKSALDVGLLRMELDVSMEHALRHPRHMDTVVKQIEQMALYNDAAANRCVYALPRAEKAIIGPSIGLATIIATAWGNCNDGGWWIRTDRSEKVVVCGGTFFDLQTNRRTGATVTRRVSGKSGRIYSDDMIAVTIQAATSIAQRNAILKGVPSPIWRPVYERALVIVRGTEATLPERRTKMIQAFAQFGVEPKRIFLAMGVREEKEITLDQMVMLRGMYEQLKDETITAEEMFDPRRMTSGAFEQVDNPLADETGDRPTPRPAVQQQPATTQNQTAAKDPEPAKSEPAADAGKGAKQQQKKAPAPAKPKAEPKARAAAEPKAEAPAPEPATEKPAAAAPAPESPPTPAALAPSTCEQYEAHATAYIAAATVAADLENRWKGDRGLRTSCAVVEDTFARLFGLYTAKLAALRGT